MKLTPLRVIRRGREAEQEWLTARGFDGLYTPDDECGCTADDLYPCGERGKQQWCVPGHETIYGIGPARKLSR